MSELQTMSFPFQYTILVFLILWFLILTAGIILIYRFFARLTKKTKEGDLVKILKKILDVQKQNTKEIDRLTKEIARLSDEGKFHVQKVGIVRFNPFKETGGDHSFSLALLDGKDSGFVLTGLHTRERTRIYLKGIKKGKSEVDLSTEEKNALTKAQKKG